MALITACQQNRNCLFTNNPGSKIMEDNHSLFSQTSHGSQRGGSDDIRTDEQESNYSDFSLCSTVKCLPTSLSLCNSFFSLYKKRSKPQYTRWSPKLLPTLGP